MNVRVRWGEADAMGIVFYPNFFAWFDQAAHELLRGPGTSMASLMERGGYAMPIIESGARFNAPAFYDDDLVVISTVTNLGSRSFRLEHVVERDGTTIAKGFEIRVLARRHASGGRLEVERIPDDVRAWLAGD